MIRLQIFALSKGLAMPTPTHLPSVCPHDCTSTCALEVEVLDNGFIGKVRGSQRNTYTAGVICEKVARYAERQHHPDRLHYPMMRTGPKGSQQWKRIPWEEALDRTAEAFLQKASIHQHEKPLHEFHRQKERGKAVLI